MAFLNRVLTPDAVTMFVLALICLCGYAYPGYRDRDGVLWLLWLLGGLMAIVVWVKLTIV